MLDERTGRVVGVTAKPVDDRGRKVGDEVTYRAPVVVACDGVSSRLATALGLERRENRPMAVAVRAYYTTPRHDDPWMESWLELWDGKPEESNLLPGYGWIFGVGDGTANVGLGILNTSAAFQHVDYKQILRTWLAHTPEEWGFRDENHGRPDRLRRAARWASTASRTTPAACCWSATPAAWSTRSTARASTTRSRPGTWPPTRSCRRWPSPTARRASACCRAMPRRSTRAYGGYFTLGRVFAKMIGNPTFMKQATKYGLPRHGLMRFLLKLMANLTDPRDGDASDRIINALSKVAPDA